MNKVSVTVLFFGKARELADKSRASLNVTPHLSYTDLLNIITETFSLQNIRDNLILALNECYCDCEEVDLKSGDEIAVIPPISGG